MLGKLLKEAPEICLIAKSSCFKPFHRLKVVALVLAVFECCSHTMTFPGFNRERTRLVAKEMLERESAWWKFMAHHSREYVVAGFPSVLQ